MKKTKNFVARILTWIRNLVRIVRLIYNKRQKKAGKIIKNETIRTVKTTHDKLFWFLEYIIPIVVIGLIIMVVIYFTDKLGLEFSCKEHANWFIIISSIVIFIGLYEIIKLYVRYLIDKYFQK